jgi:Protein of unknown function (DUF3108)
VLATFMSNSCARAARRISLLCFVLALVSVAAFGQSPAKRELPFAKGEELFFQAEFNRSLLRGVNVGELRFTTRLVPDGESNLLHLVGDVSAKGLLLRMIGSQYHLRVESITSPDSFALLRTTKLEEDRRRTRTSEAVFDHTTRKATWTDQDKNQTQPAASTTLEFTEPIQDVLTVLYFVRTQKLQPGQNFEVPLIDNGRFYRCTVHVMERKRIKTILGRVDAVRVEPAIFGDDRVVRSRGTLSLWVTDDARHIPVKAQVKVPAGTFDITLKKSSYTKADLAR